MGREKWINNGDIYMTKKVILDDRGRITIPKSIREKHNLIPGEKFEIIDESNKIILKIIIPKQKTVEAPIKWDKNAFLKAGISTFGD